MAAACATCALLTPLASRAAGAAAAAFTDSMQGRKAAALADVGELTRQPESSGWELTPRYAVLVRFGLWDELIALEPPPGRAAGEMAGYLYGRGVALAARGRLAEARAALAELERLGTSGAPEQRAGANTLKDLVRVAAPIVAARIAATEYRAADAIAALEQAVAAEDRLSPDEPPDWFFPVRDLLGAELLLGGRAADAVRIYREELARNPASGWALYGLAAALRAEGRSRDATAAGRAFQAAWQSADVRLVASAFWFGGPDNTRCECERTDAAGR
jgi:tetratricopeptide (TPR) repeat protein